MVLIVKGFRLPLGNMPFASVHKPRQSGVSRSIRESWIYIQRTICRSYAQSRRRYLIFREANFRSRRLFPGTGFAKVRQ